MHEAYDSYPWYINLRTNIRFLNSFWLPFPPSQISPWKTRMGLNKVFHMKILTNYLSKIWKKYIRHNKICITLKSTPSTNISPLAFNHSQKYLMFYWLVNVRYFGLGWSMSIGLIYGVIKVLPCIFLYLHVLSSSQEKDWL